MADPLERVAALLRRRNAIDADLAAIIQQPMTSGHLGEWIAARIFDIDLEKSASTSAIDGRFRSGPVAWRTVNVRWYPKRQGMLDTVESDELDYYLVLTGPLSGTASSRDSTSPCCIEAVYLFDARQFEGISPGVRRRTASSITTRQWEAAQVYPLSANPALPISGYQRDLLQLFSAR